MPETHHDQPTRTETKTVDRSEQAGPTTQTGTGPAVGTSARRLLRLQRNVGNKVVARLVEQGGDGAVQRVLVDASTSETLYNRESATGQATAGNFSVTGSYDLTRQEDTGATVLVKIRFMSQNRNVTPPTPRRRRRESAS